MVVYNVTCLLGNTLAQIVCYNRCDGSGHTRSRQFFVQNSCTDTTDAQGKVREVPLAEVADVPLCVTSAVLHLINFRTILLAENFAWQCALTCTFLFMSDGLNHPAGILLGNSMVLASV